MLNSFDTYSREELEQLYCLLLSTIVILARLLGRPCPVVTREERRSVYMPLDK